MKCRAVTKGREQQIFLSFYEHDTWLLSQKRKKKDKKITFPLYKIVYTQELEILVTAIKWKGFLSTVSFGN